LLATKPLNLQLRDVIMKDWLDEQVEGIREQAAAADVAIAVECRLENARIDPVHLGRALGNLLDNALAHTRAGGQIEVSAIRVGGKLRLRVADSGPGVAPEMVTQLFEPFATGRPEGTGLGLAIVREIARAHGGDARLSGSEKGAAFEIEVPWRTS
jgi:signal transduction histidine kinase